MTLTNDPNDPGLARLGRRGMQETYLVLPEEARVEQGYIRPVRRSYRHERCGAVTRMALALAQTYARIGSEGQFVWVEEDGVVTDERVGT